MRLRRCVIVVGVVQHRVVAAVGLLSQRDLGLCSPSDLCPSRLGLGGLGLGGLHLGGLRLGLGLDVFR